MMWFVYILKSIKYNWIYVGMTQNVEKRLFLHNSQKVNSSKAKAPLKLLYFEEVSSSEEARKLEKYYKTNAGKEFLKRRKII